jgi:branched-chain amino acid transport system permease protein
VTVTEPSDAPPDVPGPPSGPGPRSVPAPAKLGPALVWIVAVVIFLVVDRLAFGSNSFSLANLIQGISLGSLYGIIGVGIILIYRTSRIINFAAGAVGAVPAIVALLLDLQYHVSYLAVLPIAVIGGPALAALVDVFIMRRFDRSPRLITTVVTIGVAQSLAVLGFFIPIWMGQKATNLGSVVPTPWSGWAIHNQRGEPVLSGNQIAAFIVVVAVTAGLGAFLRYTRVGIALRASAENSDRALLLGIPVKLVATSAWALAGLLSALAIFVQAPLTGTPSDATLGFDTLLYGLAAAVVARMEKFSVALGAGLAIGIIITGSIIRFGDDSVSSAFMLLIILAALLTQRRQMARAKATGEGSWQTVKQYRPIPNELRHLPEVQRGRYGLGIVCTAFMVALPFIVGANTTAYIILLPLYGIVGVSLVILTGWAGQISLGQFGLVGVAAGVSGGLIANHNIDFFAALGLGIASGAAIAIVIGLPAVRIQGLYLAVVTLAFSYAVQGFVLNDSYFIGRNILPGPAATITRPVLYGSIDLTSHTIGGQRAFYYVCLFFLAGCMAAAYAFRRNRSGRILIAARDNERAAPAYAINLARTRLAAFAVSGAIAGVAGVLFAYDLGNIAPGSFGPQESVMIFLAAAVAGISSIGWTVFGVMTLEATVVFGHYIYEWFGSTMQTVLPLLVTGPLLLLSLYFYPGGSAQNGFDSRDWWLRRIAQRRDILVPSLVADRRAEEQAEADVVLAAERHVQETAVEE